jgi:protein-tyrosine-phosphatase
MMKQAGAGYESSYLVEELARNMDIIVIMDKLRVREIVQYTGEIRGHNPVFQTLYRFDVQEENKHELLGNWRRNRETFLSEKLIFKAKLNGTPIPADLKLIV